jgi:hypothetical protein
VDFPLEIFTICYISAPRRQRRDGPFAGPGAGAPCFGAVSSQLLGEQREWFERVDDRLGALPGTGARADEAGDDAR